MKVNTMIGKVMAASVAATVMLGSTAVFADEIDYAQCDESAGIVIGDGVTPLDRITGILHDSEESEDANYGISINSRGNDEETLNRLSGLTNDPQDDTDCDEIMLIVPVDEHEESQIEFTDGQIIRAVNDATVLPEGNYALYVDGHNCLEFNGGEFYNFNNRIRIHMTNKGALMLDIGKIGFRVTISDNGTVNLYPVTADEIAMYEQSASAAAQQEEEDKIPFFSVKIEYEESWHVCAGFEDDHGCWYNFTPAATGTYVIESYGAPDINDFGDDPVITPTLDPRVELYDSDMNLILISDDYGNSFNYRLSTVLQEGETYYIYTGNYAECPVGFDFMVTGFEPITSDTADETPVIDVTPTADETPVETPVENPETPATPAETPAATETPAASASVSAPATLVAGAARTGVEGFVDRLYVSALNRNADSEGRAYWINLLNSKQQSGTQVANGFFGSVEFASRNLDDEQFVTTLYKVFFDRKPDQAGLENWINALNNGATRSQVIAGFTGSSEWTATCNSFGIDA